MSKRVDYAFKSYVLKEHTDLLRKQRKSSLLDYAINDYEINGVVRPILTCSNDDIVRSNDLYRECVENGLNDVYFECIKINNASYKRTKRLKERIGSMLLDGSCIFLTLTFNDDTLFLTNEKQRRVAVSRYLKQFNCKYVANIDFGAANHREHYHALIQTDCIDYTSWYKYGSIKGERIRNKDLHTDKTVLAKYICKLSNHAIKETTRRSTLMYSR